jgi:hypothetical protein
MTRCDDFYGKWKRVGNFCEKNPRTVEQIEVYLDKIVPLLDKLSAESEILNNGSTAIALELSETASRPLVSEKDPEVQREAMQQIVTLAEEKVMDGKKPQVTNREVSEIIGKVKGTPAQEPEPVDPLVCPPDGAQEEEHEPMIRGHPGFDEPTPEDVQIAAKYHLRPSHVAYAHQYNIPISKLKTIDELAEIESKKKVFCCAMTWDGFYECSGCGVNFDLFKSEHAPIGCPHCGKNTVKRC